MIDLHPTKLLKVLLVDDHLMFLEGMKSLLSINESIENITTAITAEEAFEEIKSNAYDLIITDISLPGMNGIELVKKSKKIKPDLPILVLSMHFGRELVKEILSAEAEGYLLKKATKDELFNAVDKITHGGTYYSSEITSVMMDLINQKQSVKSGFKSELTPREREILQLICREYSSKEIADQLCIGTCTVETHRRSMFQKTDSKSVVGLIRYAVENKLALW